MTPVIGSAMAEARTKTGAARRARDIARSDTGARGTARTARAGARAATLRLAKPQAERIAYIDMARGLFRVLDAGRSRLHAVMIAAAVTLCTGAAWSVRAVAGESLVHHHVLDLLFGSGLGGFPVVPIVSSGALGFLVGRLWQPLRDRFDTRTCLAIGVFFVAA